MHQVKLRLPFTFRELHTDNGSEFINHLLLPWCRRQGIAVSRGRPYKKNDQAYVEQKNWLSVRRHVGHDRYNSKAAYAALQELYTLLRLQINFFRPGRKLVAKERRGASTVKHYDEPQTPYRRLLDSAVLDRATKEALANQFRTLNPAELQRRIESTLGRLWSTAGRQQESRKLG